MAEEKTRWEEFNLIIDTLNLDIKEKGLLLVIFRYVNSKKGYADPSRTLIKKLTGIKHNNTLDNLLDSLINKGFLIRESGKGKRSKYFIKVDIKIEPSSINMPSAKVEPLVGAEIEPTVGAKVEPQKENKRKIKENMYSYIFDFWNNKKIIVHKSLNKDIEKAIDNALKKYSEEEIVQAIDTYNEILKDEGYYFNYKWGLKDFLNRSNGISTFMDEGSNKVNYEDHKKKEAQTKKAVNYDSYIY